MGRQAKVWGSPGSAAHPSSVSGRSGSARTAGTVPLRAQPHLQPAQRLLPQNDLLVLVLGGKVAVHKEAQHAQRRRVDAKVLRGLLQVGRALAACGPARRWRAAWEGGAAAGGACQREKGRQAGRRDEARSLAPASY